MSLNSVIDADGSVPNGMVENQAETKIELIKAQS